MSFDLSPPLVVIATREWADRATEFATALDEARNGTPSEVILAERLDSIAQLGMCTGCVMLGFDRAAAEALLAQDPETTLIVISDHPPAIASSCWFPKPPPMAILAAILRRMLPQSSAKIAHRPRRKTDTIVGNSPAIEELLRACSRLAPLSATVLVHGETGTGKELVARALHYSSPRGSRPLVAINCAAIPETMMESELFGHQRGAFTGAVSARAGAFEAAEGGTLFLDEIGELPMPMQPKLLRVLDSGEVTRLGSNTPVLTSCRVIVATNRELQEEVQAGNFREDLYYRISIHTLRVPALRERPDDIAAIVTHHLSVLAERESLPVPRLTTPAIAKLLSHDWPGNVRELLATIERAALVAKDNVIDADDIALPKTGSGKPCVLPYREAKAEFEHNYFENLMRTTHGNISMAASVAKKTRKEIYEALRRNGMSTSGQRALRNATKSSS